MKRAIAVLTFLVAVGAAGSALAWMKPAFENVDKNGDGVIVFEEIVIFNAKLTKEGFAEIDRNGDGKVDRAEYAALGGRSAKTAAGKQGKVWWRCSGRDGMMLFRQGTDLLLADRNAEAAAVLRQAVTKHLCVDYLAYSYYNLGVACMRLGDDACARTNLEKARALDINCVVPPNHFGLDGTPRKGGRQ